jgi:ketosteroid isomerase-like protein
MTDPAGFTIGKEASTTAWKGYLEAGFTFDQSDFKAEGNRVTSCYKVYEKGSLLDEGCGAVTHVRDGKIIFDGLEPAEKIWVVQKYYEALNAKQLDLAMSFVAGDAVFINPTGTYEGADAIRDSLAGLNTESITFDLSNFRNMDGKVVYDYRVMQGENLLDQGTNGLTVVRDGKITFDGTEDTQPVAAEQPDPAAIAQEFYEATNAGNLEAAMALVAEDIKCRGGCYLTGKEAFRSYIQGGIKLSNGGWVELSGLQVEGDQVSYRWEAYNRDGNLSASGNEVLQIREGKIVLVEILP